MTFDLQSGVNLSPLQQNRSYQCPLQHWKDEMAQFFGGPRSDLIVKVLHSFPTMGQSIFGQTSDTRRKRGHRQDPPKCIEFEYPSGQRRSLSKTQQNNLHTLFVRQRGCTKGVPTYSVCSSQLNQFFVDVSSTLLIFSLCLYDLSLRRSYSKRTSRIPHSSPSPWSRLLSLEEFSNRGSSPVRLRTTSGREQSTPLVRRSESETPGPIVEEVPERPISVPKDRPHKRTSSDTQ